MDLVPRRRPTVERRVDGTSSVVHWVQTIGVPHTEIGRVRVEGADVDPSYVVRPGDTVDVHPRAVPQDTGHVPAFVCDVHLGALARWLRMLGIDTAYGNDLDDDALLRISATERRTLLTRDRGLLRRRHAVDAAFVRGSTPTRQVVDVVRRFGLREAVRPFTRCPSCNGAVAPVAKSDVAHRLEPGTRRTYDAFGRCTACGQVYWRGAHHARIDAVLAGVAATAGVSPDPGGRYSPGP